MWLKQIVLPSPPSNHNYRQSLWNWRPKHIPIVTLMQLNSCIFKHKGVGRNGRGNSWAICIVESSLQYNIMCWTVWNSTCSAGRLQRDII